MLSVISNSGVSFKLYHENVVLNLIREKSQANNSITFAMNQVTEILIL